MDAEREPVALVRCFSAIDRCFPTKDLILFGFCSGQLSNVVSFAPAASAQLRSVAASEHRNQTPNLPLLRPLLLISFTIWLISRSLAIPTRPLPFPLASTRPIALCFSVGPALEPTGSVAHAVGPIASSTISASLTATPPVPLSMPRVTPHLSPPTTVRTILLVYLD